MTHDPIKLPGDKWLMASLLHKAIRRGDTEKTLQAARALWQRSRKLFWQKLRSIAVQDVGIGNVALVQSIHASISDEHEAMSWACALSSSPKCSAPFDMTLAAGAEIRQAIIAPCPDVQGIPLYAVDRALCIVGPACIRELKKAVKALRPYTAPQIDLGLYAVEGHEQDRVLISPRLEEIEAQQQAARLEKANISAEGLRAVQETFQEHWPLYQAIRTRQLQEYLAECVWRTE